jgi:hypothetical protein
LGTTCSLHRATQAEFERLVEDPDALADFLNAYNDSGPPVRVVRPKGMLGFILRLFPITITEVAPGPDIEAAAAARDPESVLDIEKAWQGLHFLLTGTAEEGEEPASFLIRGGEDLGDEGGARALGPNDVLRFADHLATLSSEQLEQRYDPVRMTRLRIYPTQIWKRPPSEGESPREWLLASFVDLKAFFEKAAAAGDAVVIQVS